MLMTNEQRSQIITSIIDEVEEKGSARLGYHAALVLNMDLAKPVHIHIKSKIRGKLIADGRYLAGPHPNPRFKDDYEVTVNPDYKQKTWWDRHPGWDKVRAGSITAIFTLVVGCLLYYFTTGKDQKDRQKAQDDKIATLEANIERSNILSLDRLVLNIKYMALGQDSLDRGKVIESIIRFKSYLDEGASNPYLIKNEALLKKWNEYLIVTSFAIEDQKRGKNALRGYLGLIDSKERFCNYFMDSFHMKVAMPILKP
jgi:hypothetical protein